VRHKCIVPEILKKYCSDEKNNQVRCENLNAIFGIDNILDHFIIRVYNKMKDKRLPLSGSEVKYTPLKWNSKNAKWNNNCYAYAVNDLSQARIHKSQPGNVSGMSDNYHSYTTCKGLAERVISDNPGKIYVCPDYKKPCPRGYFKVMLFVSPTGQADFHWYKQHGDVTYKVDTGDTVISIANKFKVPVNLIKKAAGVRGVVAGTNLRFHANIWSHKRGWGDGPLITDASGQVILNPKTADKKYGELNYKKFCHAFCVKRTGVKVGKRRS
jgi:hypothetical protein